jgi:large repetitive protein
VEMTPEALAAAALAGAAISPTPTGHVTFKNGETIIGVVPLEDGKASLSLQTLRPGNHNISASYGANGNYSNSTSSVIVQNVTLGQLAVALGANPNPAFVGQMVTLQAIVLAENRNPTGTVTFLEKGMVLGTAQLVNDEATLSLPNLSEGRHDLVAYYNGDGGFAATGSEPLVVRVVPYQPESRLVLPVIQK